MLASAEAGGRLYAPEDELFRFARIVEADGARAAWLDRARRGRGKADWSTQLLERRAAPETVRWPSGGRAASRVRRRGSTALGQVRLAAAASRMVAQVVAAPR